jgi:hypothetical protein
MAERTMSETLYKFLNTDLTPCHGGTGKWRLNVTRRVRGTLVPCRHGIHAVRAKDLIWWIGPALFEFVAVGDEHLVEDKKLVFRAGKITRRIDTWNEKTQRLFAADCAEHIGPKDPRSIKAIRVARAYARGEATKKELEAARHGAYAAANAAAYAAAYAAANAAAYAAAAADAAAYAAAYGAAYGAARASERYWQSARLLDYIEGRAK